MEEGWGQGQRIWGGAVEDMETPSDFFVEIPIAT